jgi:hypothetical protein
MLHIRKSRFWLFWDLKMVCSIVVLAKPQGFDFKKNKNVKWAFCQLHKTNVTEWKLIRYQFWCTRCTSRLLKSLQWCSGWKSWKSEKNVKTERAVGWKPNRVPWNWAKSVEERAMPEGDNPSFWNDRSIHIRIWKQVPKYLATGL